MKNNKISEDINVLKAMIDSQNSGSDYLKLPNLFALYEKTPRFIRGLNWSCDNNEESNIVTVYNPMITDSNKTTYIGEKTTSTNKTKLQIQKDKDYRLPKILTDVDRVHFHTYDHFVEKETHRHNMFSDIEGGVDEYIDKKNPGYLTTLLHHYHCRNTRGGHIAHLNKWLFLKMMNYDKTCSQSACVTYSSTGGYRISTNQSSGQSEKDWQKDGKNWTKYCLGGIYEGNLHCKFTPIPTTSLYIFNASIYNNRGHLDKLIVKKNTNKVTGDITDATRDTVIDNRQRGTWKTNKTIVNEKDGTETTISEGLENESNKYFYMGADGKKHKLSEAPISHEFFNIEDTNTVLAERLIEHAKEIETRKWWARKANEAEGFIPISFTGKAGGRIILSWSRDERSGSKSSSRNTYEDNKYNIASYIMTPDEGYDEEKSFWRCWSSIAYTNSAKLGVGNITNYIENKNKFDEEADYYDTNLVT